MKVFVAVLTVFALGALPSESIFIGRPLRHKCPKCPPTVAAPPETTTTEATTTTEEPTTTEATTEPPFNIFALSFSCEGKPDGVYGLRCSRYFVSCVNELAHVLRCPHNLKYDSVSGRCLREEHISGCGGAPTEPEPIVTAAPTTTTEAPMETEPTTVTAAAPVETTTKTEEPTTTEGTTEPPFNIFALVFSCEGKPDGVYGLGCSQYFVCCVNGLASDMRCPHDLKYDSVSGRCLRKEHISACGGTPTEPEPIVTAPPTTTTEAPMETEPTTVTAAAPVETTTATRKCGSKKCHPDIVIGSSF